MKVMLVNGSPHKNGSTNAILVELAKEFAKNGIESEIFWVGAKPVSGCLGCYKCSDLGKCVITDDGVNDFAEKAKDADAFIFGTPVHYAAASGSLTSFMDRLFYSRPKSYYNFKPAAVVTTARRAGTTATYDQINKYFGIMQMPIISTRYWNMVFSGENPEDIINDTEGIQAMRMLARNMSYYLKCMEAGREKGINPPEQEETSWCNFQRSNFCR